MIMSVMTMNMNNKHDSGNQCLSNFNDMNQSIICVDANIIEVTGAAFVAVLTVWTENRNLFMLLSIQVSVLMFWSADMSSDVSSITFFLAVRFDRTARKQIPRYCRKIRG